MWGCIFAQCADMHPRNTDKYCFGHLPPPCTASPTPQLRAHLRLLVVMIFAKGERNCTGRTVSEHLANRKAGKAHNKHAQMLTFSVARSPLVVIPRQDPISILLYFGAISFSPRRPLFLHFRALPLLATAALPTLCSSFAAGRDNFAKKCCIFVEHRV